MPPLAVHRYWRGPVPADAAWTSAAIASTCRGRPVNDWNDGILHLAGVIDSTSPFHLEADHRHVSNVVRYELLHRFGGLWLDHDVIPLVDLTRRSTLPWVAALDDQAEGFAMWFPQPGHPMLADLLADARSSDPDAPSVVRSGARLLRRHVGRHQVALDPSCAPYDANGERAYRGAPSAVHLWRSSAR